MLECLSDEDNGLFQVFHRPSCLYRVERWIARLFEGIERPGCPCGQRLRTSRSRTMGSSRPSIAPSRSYRMERQTARLFQDINRSGCPCGRRPRASRLRTMAAPRSPIAPSCTFRSLFQRQDRDCSTARLILRSCRVGLVSYINIQKPELLNEDVGTHVLGLKTI